MRKLILHFIRSRRTCKWFCPLCKHYKICEEDMNNEQLG